MQTGSNELMRDINTRLILETLIQNVSISRADIAKKLGLTRATVSAITEQLKQQDLILEDGSSASGQGRKAVLYRLHREHAFHLCINLSWDGLTIMCADLLGQHRQVYEYPGGSGSRNYPGYCMRCCPGCPGPIRQPGNTGPHLHRRPRNHVYRNQTPSALILLMKTPFCRYP